MTVVNPPHVLALLDHAFRGAKKVLEAAIPPIPGLRPSHFRLLDYTPPGGIRLTDLAQRADMTKQALGEFVATLQAAGLVDVAPDATDGRVRLVTLTSDGERVRDHIQSTIRAIEADLRRRVGPRKWAVFREVLDEMTRPPQPDRISSLVHGQ
jgi:DNA-binding MarR family transcriptional regulator